MAPPPPLHGAQRTGCAPWLAGAALSVPCVPFAPFAPFAPTNAAQGAEHMTRQWEPPASPISKAVEASVARMGLVSCHGADVVGCAQPSERSARRIAQPIPSVLASDAKTGCASMASADRQMIGEATLASRRKTQRYPIRKMALLTRNPPAHTALRAVGMSATYSPT